MAASNTPRTAPKTRPLPPRPAPAETTAPVTALPGAGGDGILRFPSKLEGYEEKRSVLFSIDGTDFTVWDNPPANLGLQYLEALRTQGLAGINWALERMLGAEGLKALIECEGLPVDGLTRVVEVVAEKLQAALNSPKAT